MLLFLVMLTLADGYAPCLSNPPLAMQCIPGGAFIRGSSSAHTCEQSENMRHQTRWGPPEEITLDTYYMDTTEVTFGAYQACVKNGGCAKAGPAYPDFSDPQQPITGVSWYDAERYCRQQGKHLPTEAEWEKAARGPSAAPTPFGVVSVTCDEAVIRNHKGRSCGIRQRGAGSKKGKVWRVAQKPAGQYGLFDMVGNVEEWVADWYSPSYQACKTACIGHDPKGPCHGQADCPAHTLKMVKGGSWYWDHTHATGWHRRPHHPRNKPYHHFGFRCAATVSELGNRIQPN